VSTSVLQKPPELFFCAGPPDQGLALLEPSLTAPPRLTPWLSQARAKIACSTLNIRVRQIVASGIARWCDAGY
jgi:hypothetical protein